MAYMTTLPISGRACWREPELEQPITFVEALRSWREQGPNGFRGVTVEAHWHVLNLWLHEDADRADSTNSCPDCGHWMNDGECKPCEKGSWLFE